LWNSKVGHQTTALKIETTKSNPKPDVVANCAAAFQITSLPYIEEQTLSSNN
jgi:hypothetical protein